VRLNIGWRNSRMRFYAATFATAFMELEMLQRDALCDPDETPPA